jgi:hypothetical protein
MKTAGSDPVGNLILRVAQLLELPCREHAVLSHRERSDPPITWTIELGYIPTSIVHP